MMLYGLEHTRIEGAGDMDGSVKLEMRYGASNYAPMPVTIVRGKGVYLWDESGRRYIDMMGAYSAASFGHSHPRLVRALTDQARQLDTISRAYFNDRLGPFSRAHAA